MSSSEDAYPLLLDRHAEGLDSLVINDDNPNRSFLDHGQSCEEPPQPPLWLQCFSEILGTLVMIAFATGVNAQEKLTQHGRQDTFAIHFSSGLAVCFGILVAARISGAHLNPVVSLAFASLGQFSWKKLPLFFISQFIGAFLGAAFTYSFYVSDLNAFDGGARTVYGPNATHGIFLCNPLPNLGLGNAFMNEFLATFLLLVGIVSIGDRKVKATQWHIAAFVGLLVVAIGCCFGANTGYAINPVRDMGPRLFLSMAGYGVDVFTINNSYFWIPFVAPFLGGVVGAQISFLFQRFG